MRRKSGERPSEGRESRGLSRREFARRATVAAAGIAAAPLEVFGRAVKHGTGAAAQQPPSPGDKLSAAGLAEAEAKTEYALAVYGARLTDEQKTDLRRLIKEGVEPLVELRKYALANGIQPATVLRLYPEPGIEPQPKTPPVNSGRQRP